MTFVIEHKSDLHTHISYLKNADDKTAENIFHLSMQYLKTGIINDEKLYALARIMNIPFAEVYCCNKALVYILRNVVKTSMTADEIECMFSAVDLPCARFLSTLISENKSCISEFLLEKVTSASYEYFDMMWRLQIKSDDRMCYNRHKPEVEIQLKLKNPDASHYMDNKSKVIESMVFEISQIRHLMQELQSGMSSMHTRSTLRIQSGLDKS